MDAAAILLNAGLIGFVLGFIVGIYARRKQGQQAKRQEEINRNLRADIAFYKLYIEALKRLRQENNQTFP